MDNEGLRVLGRVAAEVDGEWYQVMPMGTFRGMVGERPNGKKVRFTEVVDGVAIDRIMAQFRGLKADPDWEGFLVGKEHYSQDTDGTTEAYAWATDIEARTSTEIPERQRGIWAKFSKTSLGEGAIGSVYKFRSAVTSLEHIDGDRYRPVAIDDIGLTNKPAHKTLVPARHRDRNAEEEINMLEKLRQLLARHKISIADDAGEDAALDAVGTAIEKVVTVDELTQRAVTAEHRVTELEAADLDRRADAFVAQHKDRFGDPKKLKARFKADPEGTEELIGGLRPVNDKEPQKVLHRDQATTPDGSPVGGDGAQAKADLQVKRDEAVDTIQARHRSMSRADACAMAQRQSPDLWKEETDTQE